MKPSPSSASFFRGPVYPPAFFYLLIFSFFFRIFLAGFLGPGFDESYYFSYSLRPDLSYFDHPPMVGYLAGLFPRLLGRASPFLIRLPSVLLFTFSGIMLYRLALLFQGPKTAVWEYALFNLAPLFFLVSGVMILPDAPLVFFWTAALFYMFNIFCAKNENRLPKIRDWILAGVFIGLAALSKYHGVFLGFFLMGFCLIHFRRVFSTPGPYVCTGVSLVVFSPVIIWNARHHFVSFLFQGGRDFSAKINFFDLLQALGGQAGYLTPLVFALCVWALIKTLAFSRWKAEPQLRFFFYFGAAPVLFFNLVSLFRPILPHWPLPGYLVLTIPAARLLTDLIRKRPWVLSAARIYAVVTLAVLVLLAGHVRYGIFHLEYFANKGIIPADAATGDATLDMVGWDEAADWLRKKYAPQEVFLFSHRWFIASEMELACSGAYPTLCFNGVDPLGFGIWDKNMDMRGKTGIFICTSRYFLDPVKHYGAFFQRIESPQTLMVYRGGHPAKTFYFFECIHLKDRYPSPY